MAAEPKHLLRTLREYVTHWVIGGACIVLTGFVPEEWAARLAHWLGLPEQFEVAWPAGIDPRMAVVTLGVAIIVGDILLRRRRLAPASPAPVAAAAPPEPATVSAAKIELAAPALALPDKPSIAVLPFQNLSGDAEQEYFCDGMVEEITTGLSRVRWLFVIARNSSFAYKGKPVDVRQVAGELGVRYVLEGSVRRAPDRVRIASQLVEAETGSHLWAERYDRPLGDVFALQDEITLSVVGAIEPKLRHAEIERIKRKRPESLTAYDLYLQALAFSVSRTLQDHTKALALAERVLALEPGYIGAHALMADAHRGRYLRGDGDEEERAEALKHAHAELSTGCDDAAALAMVGFVLFLLGDDTAGARDVFERALQISPSCTLALQWSAVMLSLTGEPGKAIERAERALRLSPFDPLRFIAYSPLSTSYFIMGRYAQAAEAARRGIDANPQFHLLRTLEAAALVRLGRLDEARALAARGLGSEWKRVGPKEGFQPFIAALRDAGITI